MSIISSLVVNAVVSVAIVSRMLVARKRLRENVPYRQSGSSDVYGTAAGIIVEAALPPIIFGTLASILASPAIQSRLRVIEFNLIPKMAWLAFTVRFRFFYPVFRIR